ncbi:MAG: DUF4244 domain-containing protein [Actinomycetes bacterium]
MPLFVLLALCDSLPVRLGDRLRPQVRRLLHRTAGQTAHSESGQGTVEYALVLLGAAAVALLLVAWVARTDLVGRLFDTVVGKILSRA